MRVTPAAWTALALCAVAALPRTGHAEPTADQHRAAGCAHVERSEWDDAIREYTAAYQLDHDPVSLYAIGRVESQRGDCQRAIDAFRRFLDSEPPRRARASAQAELDKCEA